MFGSSAPFGSPSGGFGQQNTTPAFGAPAAPFGGGGGGFGTPTTFGASAPASSGFGGGFGSPAPAPTFGGGSTFGAPAPAPSAFGSSGGGFGSAMQSSSPFGASAPAPSSGMFGSAPAPSGGLFGSGSTSAPGGFHSGGGFGGGFGSSTTPAPAFGSTFGSPAPAPSSGLFGAPAPSAFGATNNAFGASSTSSTFGAPATAVGMFGTPAPATAGGMFGTAAGGASGTKLTPFAVTSKQDGSTTINLHSISAMAQYEQKSFEELRFEDYSQGNRGTGNATPGNTGGFGSFGAPSPAPSTGLFGAPAPTSAFGASPAPGGFGGFGSTPASSSGFGATGAFGGPSTSAFGAATSAPFGAPAPAPGGFGTPSAFGTPAPSTSLFGSPAPAPGGGLFGSPAPAPGGLFGSSTAAPAFGAPAPATGGLFGTPAPAPTASGLFGTQAPAPFGAPAPAAFGAPASTFGGFGSPAPAPSSGLFGTAAPAPFGAPASSVGLFGTPAPAPGSFFGAPAPGGFGAQAPSSVFGPPAAASSGVFGAPATPAAPQLIAAQPVGSIMPPAMNEILTAQLTALENKRKEMERSDNFRSKMSESSSVNGISLSESESLKSLVPMRASFPSYHVSPRSTSKIRPRGFASPEKNTESVSGLGNGGKPMAAPDSSAVASTTRLVIKPSPKPRIKLSLKPSSNDRGFVLKIKNSPAQVAGRSDVLGRTNSSNGPIKKIESISTEHYEADSPRTHSNNGKDAIQRDGSSPQGTSKSRVSASKRNVAPSLSKMGYVCQPPVETLEGMLPEDLAAVQGFCVERPGVGKIEWEGAVDVRDLNLDTLVVIDDCPQSASVYTQEEKNGTKPPVGTKLNRPAIITLENVFPPEGIPKEKFEKRVAKSTKRNNAELISYDSSSGRWSFRVLHFSRYALTDDDSESEGESELHFESGERGGRSPVDGVGLNQTDLFQVGRNGSPMVGVLVKQETENCELQSDLDSRKIFEDFETERKQGTRGNMTIRTSEMLSFFEESKVEDSRLVSSRYVPSSQATHGARPRGGICASFAREANVKSSSIDFGLRMGQSFRVGWSPNGSFMALGHLGKLSRLKPIFSGQSNDEVCLLQQHRNNSEKLTRNGPLSDCPQFRLPSFKLDKAKLKKVLKSYEEIQIVDEKNHLARVAKMAFSLLGYLAESLDESLENCTWKSLSSLEARRIHAITSWLVDSCAEEVDTEIDSRMSQGKTLDALLAAVTGGDRDKASNLACDLGLLHLSTILASRSTSKNDVLRQVLCWTDSATSLSLSQEYLRIYFLAGGDSKMEDDIYRKTYSPYGWRRRLAMSLVYCRPNEVPNLSSIIATYEEKVKNGVAPYPQPQYLQGTTKKIDCILYRVLRLSESSQMPSLMNTVDPLGYSDSEHDYSLAFHLSSAISAMKFSPPMTPIESASLIDSYAAQLLTSGKWEWAVYVSLCSFLPAAGNSLSFERGKRLVLQNYTGVTSKCRRCREFLEFMGVPSKWFEEALALRCAMSGDYHGHLCHMVMVSEEDTLTALEKTLIPNMFFMNTDELEMALKLLEVFARGEDSLAFAIYNFFQLYHSVSALDGACRAEVESAVPQLSETCKFIEQVLASYELESAISIGSSLRFAPAVVPFRSFLAEAMSQLSLFHLQLRALDSEIQISSSVSQILNLAQPKGHDIKQFSVSDRENICKWLL